MKQSKIKPKLTLRELLLFILAFTGMFVNAQNKKNIVLLNATAHIGNGAVIPQSIMVISQQTIAYIAAVQGNTYVITDTDTVINAKGMHLYPGLINTNNVLGLHDAEAVRATRDFSDVGEINPHLRALIAYNTDNLIVPTIKTNGILYTQATPRGALISGASSIMALEAFNWEDAVLLADDGIHLNFPKKQFVVYSEEEGASKNQNKKYDDELNRLNTFFTEAKAYCANNSPVEKNLRFEAMRGVLGGTKNLYLHADKQKDILAAVLFAKNQGIARAVIVGGKEAYKITAYLKQNNIPVMLNRVNDLPDNNDDEVDLVYRLPYLLQKDSVLFCLQLEGDMEAMQSRNLPFNAGAAVAYGLSEEQAISAITINAAKILGLQKQIGSLEAGKLASVILSKGNILDMRSNDIVLAFIAGKAIQLSNNQTELYNTYKKKYRLK